MNVLNPIMRIESQFMDAVPKSFRNHTPVVTHQQLVDYLKELSLPLRCCIPIRTSLAAGCGSA